MSSVRPGELEDLGKLFAEPQLLDIPDGSQLIYLPSLVVPSGWSASNVDVWFAIPVGYPAARPDCFWAAGDLRLENGTMPANTGLQALPGLGQQVVWFSWHVSSWSPTSDSLSTYARFILRRFHDAR